ncbi:MAG: transposase [Patescibacteria group bacterium]
MFGSFAYRTVLERHHDHLLMRMQRTIDFSFITPLVEHCYSVLGRKAYDPICMVKLLILQTLYDLSERDVVEQADTNLLFRAFLERSLDDDIPHWTLLGKFRERLGEERFADLFNRIVIMAKEQGLLDEKLRIIDSSAVVAHVDIARHLRIADHEDDDRSDRLDQRSPDSDARTGHKSAHKRWYGYKVHISSDPSSDIVTAVETTSANVADVDMIIPLVDKERALFPSRPRPIRQVTADKAYVGRTNEFRIRNILDYIIPRNNMLQKYGTWFQSAKKQRPKIERLFAEGKTNHHLGRSRYWTRGKNHIQSLLVFLTINLKRITNTLTPLKTQLLTA